MADKISRNYKLVANGTLSVEDDGLIYISIEDGPQDINLAVLLKDFDGRNVKLNCSFDDEYNPEEQLNADEETGELIEV